MDTGNTNHMRLSQKLREEAAHRYAQADKSDPFVAARIKAHMKNGVASFLGRGEDAFYSADEHIEERFLPNGESYSAKAYRNMVRPQHPPAAIGTELLVVLHDFGAATAAHHTPSTGGGGRRSRMSRVHSRLISSCTSASSEERSFTSPMKHGCSENSHFRKRRSRRSANSDSTICPA